MAHGLDRKSWRLLARAFFDLAHGDAGAFDQLAPALQASRIGLLCARYRQTRDPDLRDQIGVLLTGSQEWYIVLGRSM